MFTEQFEVIEKMLEVGADHKDVNSRIHKLKGIMHGPKIKQAEPACINDPVTGELITDKESIRQTSLNHCLKVLKKNDIREKDKEILKDKTIRHEEIMAKPNCHTELKWETYCKVLKKIKAKGKRCSTHLTRQEKS